MTDGTARLTREAFSLIVLTESGAFPVDMAEAPAGGSNSETLDLGLNLVNRAARSELTMLAPPITVIHRLLVSAVPMLMW